MKTTLSILDRLDSVLDTALIPSTLTDKYKDGTSTDFLVIDGLRFQMSHYSMEAVGKDKQQSRFVEYEGNGLIIALDFLLNTVEIYHS